MKLVFMFPGQSSRYPGMLQKLCGLHPKNRQLIKNASELLGRDLAAHYRDSNPGVFGRNQDIQVGVFLANHMFLQMLEDAGIRAHQSLGLSLGEYNHLVHIGALDFEQALLIVDERGRIYDEGPRGAMASVFPIEAEKLQDVARRASKTTGSVLEVTNFNSPRQQVLSGDRAALDEALKLLEAEEYVETKIIEREVPMHCSTFSSVGKRLRRYLERLHFAKPKLYYLPNRLGQPVRNPTPAMFQDLLSTHVYSPVLWRQSVDFVAERWQDAVFVEVGPMSVLYNLLDRKWHKHEKFHTDSAEQTGAHLMNVVAELRALRSA